MDVLNAKFLLNILVKISTALTLICFLAFDDYSLGTILGICCVTLELFIDFKQNGGKYRNKLKNRFLIFMIYPFIIVMYVISIPLAIFVYEHIPGLISGFAILTIILLLPSFFVKKAKESYGYSQSMLKISLLCMIIQHTIHIRQVYNIECSKHDILSFFISPIVLFYVGLYVVISFILSLVMIFSNNKIID